MNNEIKTYKLYIFNENYVLTSDEHELHLSNSSALVDAQMQDISTQTGITDVKKIAVLAALRIASSLLKSEEENRAIHNGQDQLLKYVEHEIISLNS